jgi:hypothetical protein
MNGDVLKRTLINNLIVADKYAIQQTFTIILHYSYCRQWNKPIMSDTNFIYLVQNVIDRWQQLSWLHQPQKPMHSGVGNNRPSFEITLISRNITLTKYQLTCLFVRPSSDVMALSVRVCPSHNSCLNNISHDCCPGPKEVSWPWSKVIGQRSRSLYT